jgi:glycosyltransferase involved in cell wall biosynthesis
MSAPEVKITIITPTFNAQDHIRQCIHSVSRQSFRDYEHLIIDGDSTDQTLRTIRELLREDQRIRLISEKDNGIYDAMNKGIMQAKSKWLYFLGSDDSLKDPDTLMNIAGYLSGGYADIVYGNVFFQHLQRIYDHEFSVEKLLKRNICHQAIFYHRSVFMKLGFYDLRYKTQADYVFNLKCWLSGRTSPLYVPELIANFADGGKSSEVVDPEFVKDFPSMACKALLEGNKSTPAKIHILSSIYRKVLLRKDYRIVEFWKMLLTPKQFLIRSIALLWMVVSSPFYLLEKETHQDHGLY